jgi:hydroxypyruvate isomerase
MFDDMRRREFLPALAAPLLLPSLVHGATEASIADRLAAVRSKIDSAARADVSTLAVFVDNSNADVAVAALNQLKAHAEAKGVTLCIANFDRLNWAVDIVERVNSPRVKILFDVYHAQTTEGDIVNSIRKNRQHIGRIEIGEKRLPELNYGFIERVISESQVS